MLMVFIYWYDNIVRAGQTRCIEPLDGRPLIGLGAAEWEWAQLAKERQLNGFSRFN